MWRVEGAAALVRDAAAIERVTRRSTASGFQRFIAEEGGTYVASTLLLLLLLLLPIERFRWAKRVGYECILSRIKKNTYLFW